MLLLSIEQTSMFTLTGAGFGYLLPVPVFYAWNINQLFDVFITTYLSKNQNLTIRMYHDIMNYREGAEIVRMKLSNPIRDH